MLKVNVLESLRKSVGSKVIASEPSVSYGARSYSARSYSPMANRYLRSKGVVLEPLVTGSVGRIKLDGVLWKARLSDVLVRDAVPVGAKVSILYREGLTLVVEPDAY